MGVITDAVRLNLIRRAFRLEWFTAGWMLIEAAVAIGAGVAADSLSLIAFGADSLIELVSAGVLLWRLNVSNSATEPSFPRTSSAPIRSARVPDRAPAPV